MMIKPSIPPELDQFLRKGWNTLLVKGQPGAGKTIFSMGIVEYFKDEFNPIYISTRVGVDKLFKQYPYLAERIETVTLRDVRRYGVESPENIALTISFFDLPSAARGLEHAFDVASRIKNPLIIVDSWEAVATQLSPDERMNVEDRVVRLAGEKNIPLIFVSETEETTTLDYTVDGVIKLQRSELYGRLVRIMEISKLRGVNIAYHKYLFTLTGGIFQVLKPLSIKEVSTSSADDLKVSVKVPSRIEGFDEVLGGGWDRGSINLIALDETIRLEFISLFSRMFKEIVSSGYGLVLLYERGPITEIIDKMLQDVEGLNERVALITPVGGDKPYYRRLTTSSLDEAWHDFLQAYEGVKQNSKDNFVVIFPCIGLISRRLGVNEMREFIVRLAELVISERQLAFPVSQYISIKPLRGVTAELSSYWKITKINASTVIYGEMPYTKLYYVKPLENGNYSIIPVE